MRVQNYLGRSLCKDLSEHDIQARYLVVRPRPEVYSGLYPHWDSCSLSSVLGELFAGFQVGPGTGLKVQGRYQPDTLSFYLTNISPNLAQSGTVDHALDIENMVLSEDSVAMVIEVRVWTHAMHTLLTLHSS